MLVDLDQLRTFVAVAEEQHLTRAADRLHMSMSAASSHVRAVEETLGTQLFIRTNRNLVLTQAGKQLLRRAQMLLSEAAQFTSFAREFRGKTEGTLTVSAGSEPETRVGDIIATMRQSHPLVVTSLFARASSISRQALNTGEVDLSILLGGSAELSLKMYTLTTVDFRVVGPIALKPSLERADWQELAALPWISPIGATAYTEMQRDLFTVRGLEPNSVAYFDNAEMGRTMLRAGVGLMLMSENSALRGAQDGYLAISSVARTQYKLFLAHQRSRTGDPLIEAFVEATRAVWPDMTPSRLAAKDKE